MISFLHKSLSILMRPRVLHSIPGRMRLNLPVLKQLGDEVEHWFPVISRLIEIPQAVLTVSPNAVSGNIVIEYDPRLTNPEQLLHFLNALMGLCLNNRDKLRRVSQDQVDRIETQLADWLRNALSPELTLNPDLRIPDNVLQ